MTSEKAERPRRLRAYCREPKRINDISILFNTLIRLRELIQWWFWAQAKAPVGYRRRGSYVLQPFMCG